MCGQRWQQQFMFPNTDYKYTSLSFLKKWIVLIGLEYLNMNIVSNYPHFNLIFP